MNIEQLETSNMILMAIKKSLTDENELLRRQNYDLQKENDQLKDKIDFLAKITNKNLK